MESLRQPTDLVPILLNRLNKFLEDDSRAANHEDKLNSFVDLFKNMKNKLHTMEGSLPRIDTCQKELITNFRLLECHLDNHIFQQHNISSHDIQNHFNQIDTTFQSIVKLISMFEVEKMKKSDSDQTSKQPSERREEEGQFRMTLGKKIDPDDADVKMMLKHFEANFKCLESIQQKMCLLSLSVFPENSIIKKRPLIYWWMGERFGSYVKNKTAQEVGDHVFNEFVRNGFLIPVRKNHLVERKNTNGRRDFQSVNAFFINPWIHIVLIRIAQGKEYFRLDPESNLQQGSRRAFLLLGNEDATRLNGNGKDALLSIFNQDEKYLEFTEGWLSKLKKVEVLQLGRWQSSPEHHIEVENEECLKGLGSQKYLRYLSLRGISQITTIPWSVSKLISLEILDLRACHNLEKIRADLSSLRNLTHLDVSECYLLERMPKGLEELKSLQVLKGFVMGNSGKNPCKLSQLSELKKLKKLSIRITSRAKLEDGEFSSLDKFKALQTLVVQWGAVSTKSVVSTNPSADATTLSSFTVPLQLKKLDLRCIPVVSPPEWLRPGKLPSLQKLYIRGGPITSMHSQTIQENRKWGVKILRLKYLKDLKVEEEDFKYMFPEAKYIEKIACGMASDFIDYVK